MDGTSNHNDAAARAVQEKRAIPEIDFTLHTMEDGTQVSTQERVCKGMHLVLEKGRKLLTRCAHFRGASAGFPSTD